MKKSLLSLLVLLLAALPAWCCTSIMVGRLASTDGSVITSHTCDGRYRTWAFMEPAADHRRGDLHDVLRGTMHTTFRGDTTGVRLMGQIPEVLHTYAYLNTAYPCLNEHQLAIGETTFGGPDTLVNEKGLFTIEELERVALQRCDNARDAIRLIGQLIKKYGYGDSGECITIADKNEVWQMEILGEGPEKIGGVWAAQRIPDDHVGVSANIPRIGKMDRKNKDFFMASDNVEKVAQKYGLWDGKGEFVFWRVFNCDYAKGRNFHDREFFILNALAPSLGLTYDMDELPFSVKPDSLVDVHRVMELFRSTFEGTFMDMCQNVKMEVGRRNEDGSTRTDTIVSPVANPWLGGNMQRTLNFLAPGTIEFRRTVAVAWCSYSHITQLRNWLPDEVGGVCWLSVDNPGESPRIPIFCGTTRLPEAYDHCGQYKYQPDCAVWQFRKANKLATVAWQSTKGKVIGEVLAVEKEAARRMPALEAQVKEALASDEGGEERTSALLNACTADVYRDAASRWDALEADFWQRFGLGF
ncbi:MAG: C69 family dipeptidase [Bacteroidaceae bacterium]|nr:C69 family dipeptidase [Bacteroidaceae bacterium]